MPERTCSDFGDCTGTGVNRGGQATAAMAYAFTAFGRQILVERAITKPEGKGEESNVLLPGNSLLIPGTRSALAGGLSGLAVSGYTGEDRLKSVRRLKPAPHLKRLG